MNHYNLNLFGACRKRSPAPLSKCKVKSKMTNEKLISLNNNTKDALVRPFVVQHRGVPLVKFPVARARLAPKS